MKRTVGLTLVATWWALTGLLGVPVAEAATTCSGTVSGGTIEGDVFVPPGSTCSLRDGATVRGDVLVRAATLVINSSSVLGDVIADQGDVRLRTAFVGGSLAVRQGAAISLFSVVAGDMRLESLRLGAGLDLAGVLSTDVGGALTLAGTQPSAQPFAIASSSVERSVVVRGNQSPVEIDSNDIGGALACDLNVPPPTGGNNRAAGGKFGQCASL